MAEVRQCRLCGKEFEIESQFQFICSYDCRWKLDLKQRPNVKYFIYGLFSREEKLLYIGLTSSTSKNEKKVLSKRLRQHYKTALNAMLYSYDSKLSEWIRTNGFPLIESIAEVDNDVNPYLEEFRYIYAALTMGESLLNSEAEINRAMSAANKINTSL